MQSVSLQLVFTQFERSLVAVLPVVRLQLVHKKSRPATEPVASPFDLTEEGDIGSANAMAAPPPKKNPTAAKVSRWY